MNKLIDAHRIRRAEKGPNSAVRAKIAERLLERLKPTTPEKSVRELIKAHAQLEDRMTSALWIRRNKNEVCLVEVIPTMEDDENAGQPIRFNPGAGFKFPLALIAGNRRSIETAIKRNRRLAAEILLGKVMYGEDEAKAVLRIAKRVSAEVQ